jgi:GR25 family glycosyltransferase involved in LPS biosynthesis
MNLNELFPLSYCTNMDYRPDRWEQAQQEISKVGITPIRASGVIWNGTENKVYNGYIGCGLTHLNCLKLALEKNESVLMFEDDVLFINDYLNTINSAIEELPTDWDMFYLGGNICRSIFRFSEHLGRLTHAQATHAYGVNKIFLPYLVSHLETRKDAIIDVIYGNEIIPRNKCFITIPMVAIQRNGQSDIEGKNIDFNWMEQRFKEQLI